jgi:gas vesicle protein
MRHAERDSAGTLGWFLLGGALGAIAAVLLTPQSGRETRDLLLERGSDVARRAQALATEAQGRAGQWLDRSRELFEEQTQRLMSSFEAAHDLPAEEVRRSSTPPLG